MGEKGEHSGWTKLGNKATYMGLTSEETWKSRNIYIYIYIYDFRVY